MDAEQRADALDTRRSFCVSAPAGSGKTELLIQRFLALLARVERPEQVLAITFTRKAAAEMQARVAQALDGAVRQLPVAHEHDLVTRKLAVAALAAGERQGWQLQRDAAALNIKTIDSFCAGLTRQMPVLSRFGGQATPTEDAQELYREAVRDLLALIDSGGALATDLRALLLHFDNNWDRLETLLVSMLARRDQWQDYTGAHMAPQDAERRLLDTVQRVVEERLGEVSLLLDPWEGELGALLGYARSNLGYPAESALPPITLGAVNRWREVAELLLTSTDGWRKTVNVAQGFPPGKGEATEWKDRHKALTSELAQLPGLLEELAMLKALPDMGHNGSSWALVLHLSHILPNLAACLLLVFRRRGLVDYSQIAQSALDALGDDNAPTELALKLDYRIEHILVDEFQDTAINQYTLVSRLSRGWAEHNELHPERPRTLFVVGDGMQSIYGFRNANVGLFLRAQAEGFNGVRLEPLVLQSNFRSRPGIVDWVNDTFSLAFPAENNHRRGRVSFSPAIAVKSADGTQPAVSMHAFTGDGAIAAEARFTASCIAAALAEPGSGSIAVLGRSRGQLTATLAALREQGISYAAQDMDPLESAFAIVDLMSLCRALANPADRVAWFALLRAPWCGLSLADLQLVAGWGEHPNLGYPLQTFSDPALAQALSADGASRLAHLVHAIQWAASRRDRLALRAWVEQTWLRLGGPACIADSTGLRDADTFFALLERADAEGVGLDPHWLQQRLTRLFASGDRPDARVQVMTLHKAKGLEFDRVFIPALAARPRSDSRPLLLWDDYIGSGGERGFLLAADDHCEKGEPSLYNFLLRNEKEKSDMEAIRLLYVGATRAISRLQLSACLQREGTADDSLTGPVKSPAASSLLHTIWPTFRSAMRVHEEQLGEDFAAATRPAQGLWRLCQAPAAAPSNPYSQGAGNIPERARNRVDRHVGTVVHRALEELAQQRQLPEALDERLLARWRELLRSLGLHGPELGLALERVEALVSSTLADREVGRWLLCSGHPEAAVELPLTRVTADGGISDIIIDRTFIDRDSGQRWIVDYKTSQPPAGEALAEFLARERTSYRQQLLDYRDALAGFAPGPVRCALYFCALAHLEELVMAQ